MAATRQRQATSVADGLREAPHRFEFFQAVRLLQHLAEPREASGHSQARVGGDVAPTEEPVRFLARTGASFSAAGVQDIRPVDDRAGDGGGAHGPVEMVVNFMGLTGPSGVLPHYMTTELIRLGRERDTATETFQNMFNHRLVSFFYRAWEKHRFEVGYERCRRQGQHVIDEPFTGCLLSISGMGLASLTGRSSLDDETYAFYSGMWARHGRSATALEKLVANYFGVPAKVEQFVGQWLALPAHEVSRLPTRDEPQGRNARLGETLTMGARVRDAASCFRVVLGPLSLADYRWLLPNGGAHQQVHDLIQAFVGPEFDFEIQLVLRADEVPESKLGGDDGPRLGWTTFTLTRPAAQDLPGGTFAFLDLGMGDN